ncbi:MAG TPA: hypothetical protein VGR15_03170, partial [Bacteroidota bacterium]|nr:hypothetical protein [Bacteroidota bacterium]
LQVATDSVFSLLVVNDSTIQDTSRQIGPLADTTKYYWRVRPLNQQGAGPFTAARSFSTALSSTAYHLMKSWNLISLPLNVEDGRTIIVFPSAVSPAFVHDPSTGYEAKDTLLPGVGYWVKFAESTTVGITGSVRPIDTIDVVAGWNMIGSLSTPVHVDSVIQEPQGIIISDYFDYGGIYQSVTVLEPARGYWVKSGAPGRIILHAEGIIRR